MKKLFSFFVIALMAIGVNATNGDNGTTMTGGPYKVGDYYNDGTKEGIVFEVYDGGWHGKIVSLDYSKEQWAVDAVCGNAIGATSKTGGMSNMNKIKKIPNWKAKYTAFAWCASLGSCWYLPAIEELKLLLVNTDVRDAVNSALRARGAQPLHLVGEAEWYWSSSEVDSTFVWFLNMIGGEAWYDYKNCYCSVRAVATF